MMRCSRLLRAAVRHAATSGSVASEAASSSRCVSTAAPWASWVRSSSTQAPPACFHSKPLPVESKGGLLEYSVVYTDRSVNSMSTTFQDVMKDLNTKLTEVYNCHKAVIMPGSGSYAMESAARQFGTNKKALVIRLGYFSYRWTDIFEQCGIVSSHTVLKARPAPGQEASDRPQFVPPPIDEVVDTIRSEKPGVVFLPHVETSAGIVLPDEYIQEMTVAAKEVGATVVLDGIASGMLWVDMKKLGVDAYITAPQKGWTAPACAGIVMLSEAGNEIVSNTTSSSMVINLQKWRNLMDTYLSGSFGYHTTMPTDALQLFRDAVLETEAYGYDRAQDGFLKLGKDIRRVLAERGFKSVAADGYDAPGVAVVYTEDKQIMQKFLDQGIQLAAGVPLMIGEPSEPNTRFRVGLFGIDKVYDVEKTVKIFENTLDTILSDEPNAETA